MALSTLITVWVKKKSQEENRFKYCKQIKCYGKQEETCQ
jgi:hypothetical protein